MMFSQGLLVSVIVLVSVSISPDKDKGCLLSLERAKRKQG